MSGKLYESQAELDTELANSKELQDGQSCLLVEGDIIEPGTVGVPVDQRLKQVFKEQFVLLTKEPTVPRFVLYQLATGQRSMICMARDVHEKLIFSYRDFESRPPTKRVKETLQAAIDEFLEQGEK